MEIKKIAAGAATAGVLGLGGLAFGAGPAQADQHSPWPQPPAPGHSDNSDHDGTWDNGGDWDNSGHGPRPPVVTGPGVNAGEPGNPLPPGLGYLPPPGHGGPMPQDRIGYPSIPRWVTTPVTPPLGTPPAPLLPDWATNLPGASVVWNADLNFWGVWDAQTGTFIRL